jgi:hypothetical protein
MDLCVLPQPIEAPSRSLVIAAGGGRDLACEVDWLFWTAPIVNL